MVYGISAGVLQNYIASFRNERLSAEETNESFSIGVPKNEQALELIEKSKKDLTKQMYEEYFNSYFHDYLEEAIKTRMSAISKEDLVEELKSLITDDTEDEDNSEEIAAVTNLIAEFDTLSRGSEKITPETLSASTNLEA